MLKLRPQTAVVNTAVHQASGHSVLLFTTCRYLVYALIMVRGLLAAKFLGPDLLGIYGFLTLMLQYLAYSGFGLQYAINVELATQTRSDNRGSISTSLTLTALIGVVLLLAGVVVQVFGLPLFGKYLFSHYAIVVGFVAAATLVQQVYTNIYRVYGRLAEIAVAEFVAAAVLVAATLLFRGEALLMALVSGLAASAAFAVVLFAVRAPFRSGLSLNREWVRPLLKLGLPLLVYNASFYLITMVAQTVISIFYPVVVMGYYTFATGVANAMLLGFNSISWIAFPAVLARTHADLPDEDAFRTADRTNILFGTGVFLAVFASLVAMPLVFLLLPRYMPSQGTLAILLLSQGLLSSSFGYNCLAIARKRQMSVARISFGSVLIVGILSVVFGAYGFAFTWIAVAVLFGSLLFTVLQAHLGARLMPGGEPRPILPPSTLAAVTLSLVCTLAEHPQIGAVGGAIVFVAGNWARVLELWRVCRQYLGGVFMRPPARIIVKGPECERTI